MSMSKKSLNALLEVYLPFTYSRTIDNVLSMVVRNDSVRAALTTEAWRGLRSYIALPSYYWAIDALANDPASKRIVTKITVDGDHIDITIFDAEKVVEKG